MIIDDLAPRQWVPHQARARAEGIECWLDGYHDDGTQFFTATSGTVAGLLYRVRASNTSSPSGQIRELICDCDAGRIPVLCKHLYMVAVTLEWLRPADVQTEAARISLNRHIERTVAQGARRREREEREVREHNRKQLQQAAQSALYPGAQVRINLRGLPPHLRPWRGLTIRVEAIIPGGLLLVRLPATEDRPAWSAYISAGLVKRLPASGEELEQARFHDAQLPLYDERSGDR